MNFMDISINSSCSVQFVSLFSYVSLFCFLFKNININLRPLFGFVLPQDALPTHCTVLYCTAATRTSVSSG